MQRKLLIAADEAHIRLLLEQTFEDLQDEGVELLFAGTCGRHELHRCEEVTEELAYEPGYFWVRRYVRRK